MRIIGAIVCALCATIMMHPAVGSAADRSIEITDFYVYPDDIHSFNKLGGYVWPDVTELNALIEVNLDGFRGEEKLDVFLVVFDEEDEVVSKHKGKHFLPTGEHDIVFARFISTVQYFGSRSFRMEVEIDMKGVKPVKDAFGFSLEGPDPPDVDIIELDIFNAESGRKENRFRPGGEFVFEAIMEIEDNESEIEPSITIYGVMEEDSFIIDPDLEYQEYYEQWDSRSFSGGNGLFRINARGFLPYFFTETWQYKHPFRIYITIDFGSGEITTDYARATIYDPDAGDNRYSDTVEERLIRLDRGFSWTVTRLRSQRPEHDYHRRGQ